MQAFFCYDSSNKIIGHVEAVNGDLAWALTRYVQPNAAYLKPL